MEFADFFWGFVGLGVELSRPSAFDVLDAAVLFGAIAIAISHADTSNAYFMEVFRNKVLTDAAAAVAAAAVGDALACADGGRRRALGGDDRPRNGDATPSLIALPSPALILFVNKRVAAAAAAVDTPANVLVRSARGGEGEAEEEEKPAMGSSSCGRASSSAPSPSSPLAVE